MSRTVRPTFLQVYLKACTRLYEFGNPILRLGSRLLFYFPIFSAPLAPDSAFPFSVLSGLVAGIEAPGRLLPVLLCSYRNPWQFGVAFAAYFNFGSLCPRGLLVLRSGSCR